jgi:hypothetical protein
MPCARTAEARFPRFFRKGLESRFSHLASHLRIGQTFPSVRESSK